MFDGASRTDCIATAAEYHAVVWFFHDGNFLAVFLFKFECSQRAVFYAFSAADAFIITYSRMPGDFASRDAMPVFFSYFGDLLVGLCNMRSYS